MCGGGSGWWWTSRIYYVHDHHPTFPAQPHGKSIPHPHTTTPTAAARGEKRGRVERKMLRKPQLSALALGDGAEGHGPGQHGDESGWAAMQGPGREQDEAPMLAPAYAPALRWPAPGWREPAAPRPFVEWQPDGRGCLFYSDAVREGPSPSNEPPSSASLPAADPSIATSPRSFKSTASGPNPRKLARMKPGSRSGMAGVASRGAPSGHPHERSPARSLRIPPFPSTAAHVLPALPFSYPPGTDGDFSAPTLHALANVPPSVAWGGVDAGWSRHTTAHPIITFAPVTLGNCERLRRFNAALFPVVYSDSFYSDLCHVHPKGLSTLGTASGCAFSLPAASCSLAHLTHHHAT